MFKMRAGNDLDFQGAFEDSCCAYPTTIHGSERIPGRTFGVYDAAHIAQASHDSSHRHSISPVLGAHSALYLLASVNAVI